MLTNRCKSIKGKINITEYRVPLYVKHSVYRNARTGGMPPSARNAVWFGYICHLPSARARATYFFRRHHMPLRKPVTAVCTCISIRSQYLEVHCERKTTIWTGSHSAGFSHLATVRENLQYLSRKMGFSLLFGIPTILGAALAAKNSE
jgi:hypothetical protein